MASQDPTGTSDVTFCRQCGKPIETDARFCRFCGKPQQDRPATGPATARSGAANRPAAAPTTAPRLPIKPAASSRPSGGPADGLEQRLRQLFPRHHLQDDFMHIGTIAVFFMALIGFVLGFFPAYTWLADNFLLGSIALVLFLILRESTLSHIRARGGTDAGITGPGGRYQSTRPGSSSSEIPAEAATTQSTPPAPPPSPNPPPRPPSRQ